MQYQFFLDIKIMIDFSSETLMTTDMIASPGQIKAHAEWLSAIKRPVEAISFMKDLTKTEDQENDVTMFTAQTDANKDNVSVFATSFPFDGNGPKEKYSVDFVAGTGDVTVNIFDRDQPALTSFWKVKSFQHLDSIGSTISEPTEQQRRNQLALEMIQNAQSHLTRIEGRKMNKLASS